MWVKKRREGRYRWRSDFGKERCGGLPLFAFLRALDRLHRWWWEGFDSQRAFVSGERKRRARGGGRGVDRRVSRGCAGSMDVGF